MLNTLTGHWWALVLRGVLAIVLGILALVWPTITLLALAIVFGAYALVDGIFAAVAAARAGSGRRTPFVLEAIFGILVGLAALAWPAVTLFVLVFLVAIWAIVTGVGAIMTAVRARELITGEWLYILGGAISVVFGVLVLFWPASGAVAVAWLFGIYAILFGITMIAAGMLLRKDKDRADLAGTTRGGGGAATGSGGTAA
jgi:uncharacterized membrane protein HdeD (DUF308 family)